MKPWLARLICRRGKTPPLTGSQRQQLAAWQNLPAPDQTLSLSTSRYVVLDVETSGLNLMEDRLLSIGAVAVVNGRVVFGDSYSVVLQQKAVSEHSNILLHGISGNAQRDGVPPEQALLDFLTFLGNAPLVAFHVTFDETMIRRALRDHLGLNFKHPWLDLAYLMPALNPALTNRNRSLDDWIRVFGISIDARHNAWADALATAQLFQVAMIQAAKKQGVTYSALRDLEKAQRWVSTVG